MLVFSADSIRSVPCLSVFQTLCTVKWNGLCPKWIGLCPKCFVTTHFASLAMLASVQKKIIGTFFFLPPLCWNEFWSKVAALNFSNVSASHVQCVFQIFIISKYFSFEYFFSTLCPIPILLANPEVQNTSANGLEGKE